MTNTPPAAAGQPAKTPGASGYQGPIHPTRQAPPCVDCRHRWTSKPYSTVSMCNHPAMPVSSVTHEPVCTCAEERRHVGPGNPCGLEGLLFEQRVGNQLSRVSD